MAVCIEGVGLHTGTRASVVLEECAGPLQFWVNGEGCELEQIVFELAVRSTSVRVGRAVVGTVEHLFGALAAAGAYSGLRIKIEGKEIPLLDGGASTWFAAIRSIVLKSDEPHLEVAKPGSVRVGESVYRFEKSAARSLHVEIDFNDSRMESIATWSGDSEEFAAKIAPCRTFSFAREMTSFADAGLAKSCSPESVIVFTDDAILSSGRHVSRGEPAGHKLLDLIGDLYVYGGPPTGHVQAYRPGHAATHAAIARALADGILVRRCRAKL